MPQLNSDRTGHPVAPSSAPLLGPTSVRVVAALRQRFPAPTADVTDELRSALREYVGLLKDGAYSAEQVIVLLDRVMFDVGMNDGVVSRGQSSCSITRCFIEEFQRADD